MSRELGPAANREQVITGLRDNSEHILSSQLHESYFSVKRPLNPGSSLLSLGPPLSFDFFSFSKQPVHAGSIRTKNNQLSQSQYIDIDENSNLKKHSREQSNYWADRLAFGLNLLIDGWYLPGSLVRALWDLWEAVHGDALETGAEKFADFAQDAARLDVAIGFIALFFLVSVLVNAECCQLRKVSGEELESAQGIDWVGLVILFRLGQIQGYLHDNWKAIRSKLSVYKNGHHAMMNVVMLFSLALHTVNAGTTTFGVSWLSLGVWSFAVAFAAVAVKCLEQRLIQQHNDFMKDTQDIGQYLQNKGVNFQIEKNGEKTNIDLSLIELRGLHISAVGSVGRYAVALSNGLIDGLYQGGNVRSICLTVAGLLVVCGVITALPPAALIPLAVMLAFTTLNSVCYALSAEHERQKAHEARVKEIHEYLGVKQQNNTMFPSVIDCPAVAWMVSCMSGAWIQGFRPGFNLLKNAISMVSYTGKLLTHDVVDFIVLSTALAVVGVVLGFIYVTLTIASTLNKKVFQKTEAEQSNSMPDRAKAGVGNVISGFFDKIANQGSELSNNFTRSVGTVLPRCSSPSFWVKSSTQPQHTSNHLSQTLAQSM